VKISLILIGSEGRIGGATIGRGYGIKRKKKIPGPERACLRHVGDFYLQGTEKRRPAPMTRTKKKGRKI